MSSPLEKSDIDVEKSDTKTTKDYDDKGADTLIYESGDYGAHLLGQNLKTTSDGRTILITPTICGS